MSGHDSGKEDFPGEVIRVSAEVFEAFARVLDAPPEPNDRPRALLARVPVWERPDADDPSGGTEA